MNINNVLFQTAKKDRLGHFYHLTTTAPEQEAKSILFDFVEKFIKDYYEQIEKLNKNYSNLLDHPDVLIIGAEDEEDEASGKFYKIDNAQKLIRFLEFKSLTGKRKFVIIHDAHKITLPLANKWLKTLEEPPVETTLFLLNPRQFKLIPTINSRAIELRIPSKQINSNQSKWPELIQDFNHLTPFDFMEKYQKGEQDLFFWLNELINYLASDVNSLAPKDELIHLLRMLKEMDVFNQPSATKWNIFYSYLYKFFLSQTK